MNKSKKSRTLSPTQSKSLSNKQAQFLDTQTLSSLLKTEVPRLSTTDSEVTFNIKARNVANIAFKNNSQSFLSAFLIQEKVQDAFRKIQSYNLRESFALSFEFFLVKLNDEFFYFSVEEDGPVGISLNTKKAESKLKLLLDKLDSVFTTSGFKICSSVISKSYIQHCLKNNEYFVIPFGIHKRHTKLKNKLSKESASKRLSNIAAYDCLGFAFLERYKKSKESIYLNAICSNKSFGDRILNFSELLAEFMLFRNIYLSSVDTALSYYIMRDYEIIINRRTGKNFKYLVDPSSKRGIKKPIPGSKELYGYQGSVMFRKTKRNTEPSSTTASRRSTRTRKRENNAAPKQYILQNVSFDSDKNINMVKELKNFR